MELTVNDKGEAYKYFEDVYRARTAGSILEKEPYSIGDVLQDDQDGTLWFCIRPSANFAQSNLKKAMFVSFDGIKTYNNADRSATNVPTKDEAYQTAVYLNSALQVLLLGSQETEQKTILNNIKRYAHVDLETIIARRDSIVRVDNNDNTTRCFNYSIAYKDDTENSQPVLRVVYDGTHCLTSNRVDGGVKGDAYFYTRFYNHYQKWNGGDKAQWEGDWTMSNQQMYLGDVADLQLMTQYATDKWVVLPFNNVANDGRHSKRMGADLNGAKVSRYLWTDGKFVDATARNMYNEPVLFLRTMWMNDNDKSMISSEGHMMTLLSHISYMTNLSFGSFWWTYYNSVAPKYMFVDNGKIVPFQVTK